MKLMPRETLSVFPQTPILSRLSEAQSAMKKYRERWMNKSEGWVGLRLKARSQTVIGRKSNYFSPLTTKRISGVSWNCWKEVSERVSNVKSDSLFSTIYPSSRDKLQLY